MIRWREGRVVQLTGSWPGAVQCLVELTPLPGEESTGDSPVPALAYPQMVGHPETGDRVWLNTTALDAGLGTGGLAFVIALPDRAPSGVSGPGHIVKARYTPQQVMVLAVDEPASPHHELLREADDLGQMPVLVADLHSSLPAVLAGVRAETSAVGGSPLRVAYVMTDGAALPVWFSRTVAALREAGEIVGCISAGQAFGGDLEAISLHSALLAARLVLRADLAVVAPGPGVAGAGSRWGFSGTAVGEALNAATALNGRGIAVLRVSGRDARQRHHGVSHHTLTALGRVALAPSDIVLPQLTGPDQALGERLREQIEPLQAPTGRHRVIEVPVDGLLEALHDSPVPLATMGRGLQDDAPAFLAAAAAGRHAARLVGIGRSVEDPANPPDA